jgi:hypothetical protein
LHETRMTTSLTGPSKVTLAIAAGPRNTSSAWNPWSGLQYSRYAPARWQTAVTLPSGDCSSVPAAVWCVEAVAEADGVTLAADRVLDASRSGLAGADGLGRPESAGAEGLGRSALSSGLALSVASVSC